MKFIQPVSMVCTEEQYRACLREPLLKMGYQEKSISHWELNYNTLITNLDGILGDLGNVSEDLKLYSDRYFIDTFNPTLFLALAAMSSREEEVIGEYWTCLESPMSSFTVGKVYKSIGPLDMSRAFEDNHGVRNGYEYFNRRRFRKSTLEELVSQLTVKNIKEEKEVMTQESFKTTRQEMSKIWKIACSDWKKEIVRLVKEYGETFSDEVKLPFKEVKRMFDAADTGQTEVLLSVFPTYSVNKNAWVGDFDPGEMSIISGKIFGGSSFLELATLAAESIGRSDLKGRALYVSNLLEVKVHKTYPGGTVIEFIKK